MEDYESEEVDAVGLGCSLDRFIEWKEILDMVSVLKRVKEVDIREAERTYERFRFVINQYKEQPHLLDSHIAEILDEIVSVAMDEAVSLDSKHRAFKYMHLVVNVRGFKAVLQHLPHAVTDLEPVLLMLEAQDEKDIDTWQTRYCLLLWLSIIIKIPFHMSRLDPPDTEESFTVMSRLVKICKKYILVPDSSKDACAYLTAQYLTRLDTKDKYLPEYLEWAYEWITQKEMSWNRLGPLAAIAAILKYGKRQDLLPHVGPLLKTIAAMEWRNEKYRLCRKYAIKIIQRIGLTYLKARAVSWRYQRGSRILPDLRSMISRMGDGTKEKPKEKKVESEEGGLIGKEGDDEDDQEVPQEIDEVIDELMQGLRDEDITVRWSAAKGIGRVMGRMNKQFGDEVIGCVLELLSPRENDSAWHGGCLALAEFSKRGLLLPSRLPEVIPLVQKALVYDEPLGHCSVGTHIRDAACYVAWTFARAYEASVFKMYVSDIATSLVVAFCLDREVNIRRAASAAFQEHIGRQGQFPHGIDILTAADYYAVGVRTNSYLNISVYIAQFEEYTTSIIDHLVERKLEHWDIAIRDLSAKALHNLTKYASDYMLEIVLPTLVLKTRSLDSNIRHGAIIAIGEVVHALSLLDNLAPNEDITKAIGDLVRDLREKHMFKGISGELMKIACCQFINKCSLAKMPFKNTKTIDDWQEVVNECLCHEVGNIRAYAASALPSLCLEYYSCNGEGDVGKCAEIVRSYTEKLEANDEILRVGHALALGSLPKFMLHGLVDYVVNKLMKCSLITPNTEKWVESRKFAIKAMTSVCSTVGIEDPDPKRSCRAHVLDLLECMTEGMTDYTKDDRGDTGAWVRESSMSGIQSILQLVSKCAPDLLTPAIITKCMQRIGQQAVERIDRTRALAGTVFSALLHNSNQVPHIPERERLKEIFPEVACKEEINWLSHSDTFPRFIRMLRLQTYSYHILLGLVASVGGIAESLVKISSGCLFEYLKDEDRKEIDRICDLVLQIFEEHLKVDRVVLSMLNFLEKLLSSAFMRQVLEDSNSKFPLGVFNLTKNAVAGSTDKYKLLGSIDIYCLLIQVKGEVGRKAMGRLLILLCHRFGWLRKAAATKLYECLVVYGDEVFNNSERLDSALALLSDTEWAIQCVEEVREARNSLAVVLGLPKPQLVKPNLS
ncbi:tubulin-specific chaperone D [Cimex lectularius]|uniref:Tubulin-specific chaperone D n=1 Tax=Cimex lectularius TaxID=79782 RepID=A0A8I6RVI8_CIMLE|nr:tubulin-specific chaperone D [Cimex lectularius]